MGNSKIIIAVVVGVIVLKLIAVHLYLRKSNTDAVNEKNKNDHSN